jgi:bifunctional non-homologous end joining protein LigD
MKTLMTKKVSMAAGSLIEEISAAVEEAAENNVVAETNLRYQGGGSDKVYNAWITEDPEDEFKVYFSYGRTGTSLNHGTKTASPVDNAVALKIYNKLVKSKLAKGYKDVGGGSGSRTFTKPEAVVIPEAINEEFGQLPQLLNVVKEENLQVLFDNPDWVMMPKHDGKRRMFEKKESEVAAGNRKGLQVAIDKALMDAVKKFPMEHVVLDGEDMGSEFICFDMIIHGVPFSARLEIMKIAFKEISRMRKIQMTDVYYTREEKMKAFEKLKADGQEGVVFRKLSSIYEVGRPASGGNALKFKFVETASFLVTGINEGKSSVSIGVFNDSFELTEVGNATVYPNLDMPKEGDIVEVEYLYAFKGGSVYQPVLLGTRDDLTPADCTMKQLKFKPDA